MIVQFVTVAVRPILVNPKQNKNTGRIYIFVDNVSVFKEFP